MSNSENQSKVTLEDLLRLKRSERPAADFWANFERELRQKQLSALVEKRSWWQSLPDVLFTKRVYLPISATAILTFTLVSVKLSSPIAVSQSEVPSDVGSPYSREVVSSAAPVSSPLVNRDDQADASSVHPVTLAAVEAPVASSRPVVQQIESSVREESPSARSIAANLAHLEQSDPELINAVLGSRLSSPARVQSSSQPTVELASLAMNASKRTRLVAQYKDRQLSAEPAAPEAVRERISRRLGEREINDRFSRFGLKGDQFSLRF